MRFAGHGSTEGGLQEFVVWPERCLVSIPDNVTNEQGALLEPLGVALHALDLGDLQAGETAGVIGCGPLGLLVIKALASRGVEAAAKEPLAHRMSAALDFGAVVWPEQGDGRFNVIFDCAGSDESLHESLLAVAPGCRVVLVGIPENDRSSFQASLARRKEISLRTSRRMIPQDLVRAARMAGSGEVSLDGLVTHRFDLAAAMTAFQTLVARTGIKVVVEP
jgi:L-iditol 2-dehydrogenase